MRTAWWIAPVFVVAACATTAPPVPVRGAPGDIAALAGEWSGDYMSMETGRSGRIHFRLDQDADTATGDVLMLPTEAPSHRHPGDVHPASEYIPIAFVRVSGDRVRGTLGEYRDPVCGCRLATTFDGLLRADTIAGTYTSRHIEGGAVQTGRWQVTRFYR